MRRYALITAFLIIIVLQASYTHPKNRENGKQNPTNTNKNASSYQQGTDERPFVVKTVPGPITKDAAKNEAYQAHKKPLYDLIGGITTIWIAGITTALAVLNWFLWRTTKTTAIAAQEAANAAFKNAEAAEKAAEAAKTSAEALPRIERAYLFADVQIGSIDPLSIDDPYAGIVFNLVIKNEGKTPAVITGIWAGLVRGSRCPAAEDRARFYLVEGNHVVGVNATHTQTVTVDYRYVVGPAVGTTEGDLILFGWIQYEDVFKFPHQVNFCWHHDTASRTARIAFRRCYKPESNQYT